MKVSFLVGPESSSLCRCIQEVCNMPDVEPVLLLVDLCPKPPLPGRMWRGIKRDGLGYVFNSLFGFLATVLEALERKIVQEKDVTALINKAFPGHCQSFHDLATRYGMPILKAIDINSDAAREALKNSGSELGIVLETRMLESSTFSLPSLGCVHLHKGKVPEFIGKYHGFWELYEGVSTAGVTIHFLGDKLCVGNVVAYSEIPIHKNETLASLNVKLDMEGTRLLAESIGNIASGKAVSIPQSPSIHTLKRRPTRKQRLELERISGHPEPDLHPAKRILKLLTHLIIYYSGIFYGIRWFRRKRKQSRAAIVLYHRINDFSQDSLTTSCRDFAAHLVILSKYYSVRSTPWLVKKIKQRDSIPPDTVLIHFDDCYRDVFANGASLLNAAGMPATSFISSGYIDQKRAFAHDSSKYPFEFENLRSEEVRQLLLMGFEVGAHTVNHVNLKEIPFERAQEEILNSRKALEEILESSVEYFSFPFGKICDISEDARSFITQEAGFKAVFSAYGGFVTPCTQPEDIPRFGIYSAYSALGLILEIEGLAIANMKHFFSSPMHKKRG